MLKISVTALTKKTKRLLVRPYRESDYEAWKLAHSQSPQSPQVFIRPTPKKLLTKRGFSRWLQVRNKLRGRDFTYVFGVFDRITEEHLGTIDISMIRRLSNQWASLGYVIHNQHWGKGYATEAARVVLKLAFEKLRLQRVEASISPTNNASIKVARNLGLKPEGMRKKFFYFQGQWHDSLIFSATASDWGVKIEKPEVNPQVESYL
jgi:RimJ/RimL family protein N-acetyltransferase